eukprot:jgi/Chlat1/1678/Chrsp127S01919
MCESHRRAASVAAWLAANSAIFKPSVGRLAEVAGASPGAVVPSDAVIALLAAKTRPFKQLPFLTERATSLVLGALTLFGGITSALRRRGRRKALRQQSIAVGNGVWRSKYNNGELNEVFGTRTRDGYEWVTGEEVAMRASLFGAGLRDLGLGPGDKFGIYSVNCLEWVVAEFGGYSQSMIPVSLYDSLGADAVAYVCKHAELKLVVAAQKVLSSLLVALRDCPDVKHVVVMGSPSGITLEHRNAAASAGVELISFMDVELKGVRTPSAHLPPKPSDIATLMYTSGTTGNPKGVILTHANIIAAATTSPIMVEQGQGFKFTTEDCYLSYLPLAHILERVVVTLLLAAGVKIGFYGGSPAGLLTDFAALKPTIVAGVPRVFTRIYDKVQEQLRKSKLKTALFNAALAEKSRVMNSCSENPSTPLWDTLVFKKVKAGLGGRVRLAMSGGAPLAPAAQKFLRAALGCPVIQGYGLTETCGQGGLGMLYDSAGSHVGAVVPCVELKLESCPDYGYTVDDTPCPRGEVCFRGPAVTSGYHKEPELTSEAIDADGWLHTGDIGQLNPDGSFSIIDRKKNMFKLAQGEYVASEKLEVVFQQSRFVSQVFVYGDSFQSVLVTIVVPDEAALSEWASAQDPPLSASFAELCESPAASKAVLADMQAVGRAQKLHGFEIIKAVLLTPEPFSVENDLITPSFKLKRPQLKNRFKPQIDAMYQRLNSTPAGSNHK